MAHDKKIGLFALIALVVGSMIGGGAFNLPSDMAKNANAGAILIGWTITGIGMISLGLAFQNITNRKPELDGGIYSFAKAGFGNYMGFNTAWGYWIAALLGNVAYATLLFSSIGYFFPVFGAGQNIASIIGSSILLWMVHFLLLRGVSSATIINNIVTVAKLIPIFAFLLIAIFAFHYDKFIFDFWGATSLPSSIGEQIKSTMLVTLWVFAGVEGAVVLSGRAKNKQDVGRATVIGLIGILFVYILLTVLSLGVVTSDELRSMPSPSLAFILESIVGKWGAIFINIGLIISVLGAWLGWTLLASEIPYIAGKDGTFPKWFGEENSNHAPVNSLWITNILIQLFLFTFLFTDQAYTFAYSLASSAILLPYLFSALYQCKISYTGEAYQLTESRTKDLVVGFLASIYSFWLVYAAGVSYLLLTTLLFAPGALVFMYAQKENKQKKIFSTKEVIFALAFVFFAVFSLYQLFTGKIKI